MHHYPKIKESLLKSGLPFESVISSTLDSLSSQLTRPLINHGEYFFERERSDLPNSVDFLFTYDMDLGKSFDFLQLVFLIECKYRTKGTTWFFISNPLKDAGMEFFIENFFVKGNCNRYSFPSLALPLNQKVPVVGKGIEVYSNGERNDKSIQEGLHQLMFGAANLLDRAFFKLHPKFVESYLKDRNIDLQSRTFHSLVCPIIVATSELCVLNRMSLEGVENSEKIEDIGRYENIAVSSTPKPPPYLRNYIMKTVAERNISSLNWFVPEERSAEHSLRNFLLEYSLLFPSRYYIVQHKFIESFIRDYLAFAESLILFAHKKRS